MAYEVPGQMISLESGSTAVKQFLAVSFDSSGVILPASTTDGNVFGIAQNDNSSTSAGEAINVMIGGVSKLIAAGSTLAKGDSFSVGADGHAQVLGAGRRVGIVLDGSSGSTGRLITVLLTNGTTG